MENLGKVSNEEVLDISNFTNERSVKKSHVSTSQTDSTPGTSKFCDSCSRSKIMDVNSCAQHEKVDVESLHSTESYICRICHNNENPDILVSPCLCKGTLTYVHSNCLERWISMSRCTTCELCQFQYNTVQTLRYTIYQSLRMWYSRAMSRRALQEDCQMFLLLTLIAFGIVGTLIIVVQYYILQGHISDLGRIWTKGWIIFFLLTTLVVYFINVYMIVKAQILPWYRWWQTARDIRLIIENHNPTYVSMKKLKTVKDLNPSAAAIEAPTSETTEVYCR